MLPTRKRHDAMAPSKTPPFAKPLPRRQQIHGRFSMFRTMCVRRCLSRWYLVGGEENVASWFDGDVVFVRRNNIVSGRTGGQKYEHSCNQGTQFHDLHPQFINTLRTLRACNVVYGGMHARRHDSISSAAVGRTPQRTDRTFLWFRGGVARLSPFFWRRFNF